MVMWLPVGFEIGAVLAVLVWQLVSVRREIRRDKEALKLEKPAEKSRPPERMARR